MQDGVQSYAHSCRVCQNFVTPDKAKLRDHLLRVHDDLRGYICPRCCKFYPDLGEFVSCCSDGFAKVVRNNFPNTFDNDYGVGQNYVNSPNPNFDNQQYFDPVQQNSSFQNIPSNIPSNFTSEQNPFNTPFDPVQNQNSNPPAAKNNTCLFCHKSFKRNFTLQRHLKSVHETDKMYVCPFSVTLRTLQQELYDSNGIFVMQCGSQIIRDVIQRYQDILHQSNVENPENSKTTASKSKSSQLECSKRFHRKEHVIAHLKSTHGLNKLTNKSLGNAENLVCLKTKLQCKYCECSFQRKDHVKVHEASHVGVWPISCEKCHRGFSSVKAKNAHVCCTEACLAMKNGFENSNTFAENSGQNDNSKFENSNNFTINTDFTGTLGIQNKEIKNCSNQHCTNQNCTNAGSNCSEFSKACDIFEPNGQSDPIQVPETPTCSSSFLLPEMPQFNNYTPIKMPTSGEQGLFYDYSLPPPFFDNSYKPGEPFFQDF